jgi:hypothetical protein
MQEVLKIILSSPFEVILFLCGFFAFLLGILPIRGGKIDGLSVKSPFPFATRFILETLGALLMFLGISLGAVKSGFPLFRGLATITPPPMATPSPVVIPSPTATPTPTLVPTATATPTLTPACRYDAYVTDDGKYPNPHEGPMAPGQQIIVKWTVTNKSSCPWGTGLQWVFNGDKEIGVPPSLPIRGVGIGESVKIHERISAPSSPGRYEGWWQMRDPFGNLFGDRSRIEITVQEPVFPPSPPNCTNEAMYLADLTYEDTPTEVPIVKPGQRIYKAWLLKNKGTCHWGEGYSLVPVGGAELAWESPYVPPTASGGKAVVMVTIFAPTTPGEYRMDWKMQDPSGNPFGEKFWVRFEVK